MLELKGRFDGSMREMENSVELTVREEAEVDKRRAIAAIQRQCVKDIEVVHHLQCILRYCQ